MNDQELLVLAAKAAGMPKQVDDIGVWSAWVGSLEAGHWWDPLTDDGDALRLAVKLDLCLMPYPIYALPKHSICITRRIAAPDQALIDVVELYGTEPAPQSAAPSFELLLK